MVGYLTTQRFRSFATYRHPHQTADSLRCYGEGGPRSCFSPARTPPSLGRIHNCAQIHHRHHHHHCHLHSPRYDPLPAHHDSPTRHDALPRSRKSEGRGRGGGGRENEKMGDAYRRQGMGEYLRPRCPSCARHAGHGGATRDSGESLRHPGEDPDPPAPLTRARRIRTPRLRSSVGTSPCSWCSSTPLSSRRGRYTAQRILPYPLLSY